MNPTNQQKFRNYYLPGPHCRKAQVLSIEAGSRDEAIKEAQVKIGRVFPHFTYLHCFGTRLEKEFEQFKLGRSS